MPEKNEPTSESRKHSWFWYRSLLIFSICLGWNSYGVLFGVEDVFLNSYFIIYFIIFTCKTNTYTTYNTIIILTYICIYITLLMLTLFIQLSKQSNHPIRLQLANLQFFLLDFTMHWLKTYRILHNLTTTNSTHITFLDTQLF